MDKVFQEEQIKLTEIESKIDSIVSRYENKAKELQNEIADYHCIRCPTTRNISPTQEH